jgi:hypothetical protein
VRMERACLIGGGTAFCLSRFQGRPRSLGRGYDFLYRQSAVLSRSLIAYAVLREGLMSEIPSFIHDAARSL